ncbi:MAG: class I SAM-dependent methyltransferase [Sphingomicrobium sp.]
MIQPEYLVRHCPACGADQPRDEAFSERRAEALPLDELRPFWAGLFKEKVFFTYARCGACGLMYSPYFFTPEQLGDLYANMAPNMEDVPGPALEATQKGYWTAAKKGLRKGGGFLEIGPDVGYIVRHATEEAEFDHFWLFEPNRAVHDTLARATAARPHTISTAMDDLSEVPDGSIELAVMIHVLDHLLDPTNILRQIRAKLRPGGTLMIVTHNEQSVLRKVMGVKFPPFCLQHPELYNPSSITRLLERAEYDKVEVRRSKNYFPVSFMVRQAAWTAGINLSRLPLPGTPLGLKLGNILTLASVAA